MEPFNTSTPCTKPQPRSPLVAHSIPQPLAHLVTTPPRRSFSLNARHTQPEDSSHFSPSASSLSQLSFVELAARTSSFLVDYYEAPTASPIAAAQLLTALQQFDVDGQQRQLKEKLEGELDELVNEGKRRNERRLGDDTPLTHRHRDTHEPERRPLTTTTTYCKRALTWTRTKTTRLSSGASLHDHCRRHLTCTTWTTTWTATCRRAQRGGGVARGKFDSGYSTDQLLSGQLADVEGGGGRTARADGMS